jgi:SAM-dependent methyltransferase
MPAGLVVRSNHTYRADALARLGIHADDQFPIVRARGGPIFSGWLPSNDFLRDLYDGVIDHSKTSSNDLWYRRFLWSMAEGLLSALDHRRAWSGPLKLLDYGCGYGSFARLMASQGLTAIGYEPSAIRLGGSSGVEVLRDLQEVSSRGPFDLLVCTEVLEHMAQPREALRFMRENARPDALLLITVPMCAESFVRTALDGFVRGEPQSPVFNPWEHLNYFSSLDLRHLLREEGFAPVADLGRGQSARAALGQLRNRSPARTVVDTLRVAKRLLSAPPSTQLVCSLL